MVENEIFNSKFGLGFTAKVTFSKDLKEVKKRAIRIS